MLTYILGFYPSWNPAFQTGVSDLVLFPRNDGVMSKTCGRVSLRVVFSV